MLLSESSAEEFAWSDDTVLYGPETYFNIICVRTSFLEATSRIIGRSNFFLIRHRINYIC